MMYYLIKTINNIIFLLSPEIIIEDFEINGYSMKYFLREMYYNRNSRIFYI